MSVQESDEEIDAITADMVSMFEDLDEPDRAVLLTELVSRFCMSCGAKLPRDGEDCPCGEHDEDDDDDEDDEDDEDDDEGDDGDPDEDDDEEEDEEEDDDEEE